MSHFALFFINEDRYWIAFAAFPLRRAIRKAVIRLRPSCRFTALKSTVFTREQIRQIRLKSKCSSFFGIEPGTQGFSAPCSTHRLQLRENDG